MTVTVSIDTSQLDRLLSDFPASIARAQRNALADIGAEVVSEAQQTFRNPQMRPSPWPPRKNNADPGRPLLVKSGNMRASIGWKLVGNDTVVVGTPQEYLKYHQFGTKHMPARPVLPLDKQGNLTPRCLRKVTQKVADAFANELRRIGIH